MKGIVILKINKINSQAFTLKNRLMGGFFVNLFTSIPHGGILKK